jgi:DNA polymerase V
MASQEPPGGYTGAETTGFVSPAGDHLEEAIDLVAVLELRRPHRYPLRYGGEPLPAFGILPEDILIADTARLPISGSLAVIVRHGEVLIAAIELRSNQWWLLSGRPGRAPQQVTDDTELWGILVNLIRKL